MKKITVAAAIIVKDNKFLLAKRQSGDYKGLWEFPGGKLEKNETPEQALIREIKEEMEVVILIKKHIITVRHSYPDFHLKMYCFLCSLANNNIILHDHSQIQWVQFNQVHEKIDLVPADIQVFDYIIKNNTH